MRIEILPPEVAAKIAAGEVVERPASAVKELIENAIDAGATDIRVEIREGGKRLIRVTDNGCGIPSDQVELAFARHATSKLRAADDLERIATLGFRGEALASIAAVSQFTMTTRSADEEVGVRLRMEGSVLVRRESIGCPQGTSVTVDNLYYNTPARLKFLRADTTEASWVADVVTSYALAYPERRFTLLSNRRLNLQTLGTGKLFDVITKVHGLSIAQQMIQCHESVDDIEVGGFVSTPELHRTNRKGLMLFVNRRWVQDRSLSYAVEEAYHGMLLKGRHPLAVLNIQLDPAQVDVNIHPTKREIRFQDARRVFGAVQRTVRHALQEQSPIPIATPQASAMGSQGWPASNPLPTEARRYPGQFGLELQRTAARGESAEFEPIADLTPSARLPMLRVLGQLAQTYIIAEGPGGMYLIDQHAAHERIAFEQMMADRESARIAVQALLDPLLLELTPAQDQLLEEHLDEIKELGFEMQPFGVNTWRIASVPAGIAGSDIGAAVVELLTQPDATDRPWYEEATLVVVCHSIVRAGQTLSLPEMRDLVRQLEQTSTPHSCPHGRPTMIHLSAAQLEREFGRR